jgi:peptidoglycan/LPS O-acetylase OafA/YrhL
MFGAVSYTLYMTHWFAAVWLGAHIAGLSGLQRLGLTGVVWVLTLACAWGLWYAVDRPMNRLRKAWVRQRSAASPHAASGAVAVGILR